MAHLMVGCDWGLWGGHLTVDYDWDLWGGRRMVGDDWVLLEGHRMVGDDLVCSADFAMARLRDLISPDRVADPPSMGRR